MKNLVIFSAEELYELIHDNPVVDKNSDTIYMSTNCYENGGYKNLADLQMNVEKLKARYPYGFDAGHSQHRSSGDI